MDKLEFEGMTRSDDKDDNSDFYIESVREDGRRFRPVTGLNVYRQRWVVWSGSSVALRK